MIPLTRLKNLTMSSKMKFFEKHGERPVKIWSDQWGAFWRLGGKGYTYQNDEAGIFTLLEAYELSGHAGAEKKIHYKFTKPQNNGR